MSKSLAIGAIIAYVATGWFLVPPPPGQTSHERAAKPAPNLLHHSLTWPLVAYDNWNKCGAIRRCIEPLPPRPKQP